MGYLMLATTVVLSLLALWRSSIMSDAWWTTREERAIEFADAISPEFPISLIGLFPRAVRRVLNPAVFLLCVVLFGGFHGLFVYAGFAGGHEPDPWFYVHYLTTLALWLAALAVVPFATAQHRAAIQAAQRKRAAD